MIIRYTASLLDTMSLQNKNQFFGPSLIGACLAVIASIPVAAYLAAILGDTYNVRVAVYCSLLLWAVIGAVSIFLVTQKSEQKPISISRILLWFVSAWLWPLLIIVHFLNQKK